MIMNENAEMGYVLTGAIEGTAMLVKGSAYAVQEILRLLQWAMKKVQDRELPPGEYENLAKFIQKTGGNLDYLNIPAEDERHMRSVQEDLRKLKIPYHILPDLNAGDGMVQIVYPSKYKSIVRPWFEKYCQKRLEKGDYTNDKILKELAGGEAHTGIMTIPTEESRLLKEMEEDLQKLNVSYYLMPDTNIGDGTREILYAKKDEEKIRNWQEGFCQKHIRKGGEKTAQELQTMAGNKSQIGYMNVPAKNNGEILSQMKEEFQRLGINYHVMEDMRTGDGLLQIMYLKKDEVAVRNWYSNYATDQLLRGGRQEYKDLMNLTNGKAQLVNIPISQNKVEEMLEDFNNLHINYCVMPNLKINDKGTMILYAAADADRVKGWYGMYQDQIIQDNGKPAPPMQEMSMGEYMQSSEMRAEDYIKSGSEKKPDQPGISKKNESLTDLNEDPNYLKLDADPAYQKIIINQSLVVEKGEETFLAKIPGLKDSYFICPVGNVFETDLQGGDRRKTFVAYISKNHRQLICDGKGKMQPSMDSKELLAHFDPVKRGFSTAKNLTKNAPTKLELIKG